MRSKKSIARKRSARVSKIMRHKRMKAFMRMPMPVRVAAMAILVIGVGAMAMMIAGGQPSSAPTARVDATSERVPTPATKNASEPLPRIPDIVPAVNTSPDEPGTHKAPRPSKIAESPAPSRVLTKERRVQPVSRRRDGAGEWCLLDARGS